jgi:hypothetical protein
VARRKKNRKEKKKERGKKQPLVLNHKALSLLNASLTTEPLRLEQHGFL